MELKWLLLLPCLIGACVAFFAAQIARWNVALIDRFPVPLKRFYTAVNLGHPYDSPFWIAYNRIGGIFICLAAALAFVFLK